MNDVWGNASDAYGGDPKPRFVLGDAGKLALTRARLEPPDRGGRLRIERGPGLSRALRHTGAWLADHSRLYFFVRARTFGRGAPLHRFLAPMSLSEPPYEWRGWWKTPDAETEEAWRVTEALLAALRDEVEDEGSRFVIFQVPSVWAVYDAAWKTVRTEYALDPEAWDPHNVRVRLGQICRRQELDCILPLAAFQAAAGDLEANALYYRKDEHWAPQGHALAARTIAGHLLDTRAVHGEHRRVGHLPHPKPPIRVP